MQKAFPKVVLAILVVIVLGVMLIGGLTGDGPANDRALSTVLIAGGVGVLYLLRHLWKRRGGGAIVDESDRSDEGESHRDQPSGRSAYVFSAVFIAIGIVVALVYPLDATTIRRGLPIWLVSGVLVVGGLFLFLHTLHSRRDKGDSSR